MTEQSPNPSESFRKKRFTPHSFLSGVWDFIQNIPRLVRAVRADRVDAQFAEKIMLAVTAVNECRYCTRYHTSMAQETGIDQSTIDLILESDIDTAVDETEKAALVFAQRYAEANGDPPSVALSELRAAYGSETARDVQAFVRAIYFGNLSGNTVDALKFAAARRANRSLAVLSRQCVSARDVFTRLRNACPS
jgi:AhpD family alkylhydroperoxidase